MIRLLLMTGMMNLTIWKKKPGMFGWLRRNGCFDVLREGNNK